MRSMTIEAGGGTRRRRRLRRHAEDLAGGLRSVGLWAEKTKIEDPVRAQAIRQIGIVIAVASLAAWFGFQNIRP